jgi:hypothetical protein
MDAARAKPPFAGSFHDSPARPARNKRSQCRALVLPKAKHCITLRNHNVNGKVRPIALSKLFKPPTCFLVI